jgi:hypothetical protein
MLYAAFYTRHPPYSILFVNFEVVDLRFVLKIYRFVPVRFKHMQTKDDLAVKICHEIKKKVFERQMEYINKLDHKKRNPHCDVRYHQYSSN